MQTPQQPVDITARVGRLTAGIFNAGPFKGQRAITLDNGVFLPAGKAPTQGFANLFDDVFGPDFAAARKGGAA